MDVDITLEGEETQRERIRLRTAVLHYGGLLGWQASEVIALTEALTNCSWRQCGCAEFHAVLDEYLGIMEVIQAKASRRLMKEIGGCHAAGD